MKRILFALVAITVLSCAEQNKPETINEIFEPTDQELFAECEDLKGVSQFLIGKTTFKAVLNDKDFKKSTEGSYSSYNRQSNLVNGHWEYDFWKTKNDGLGINIDKSKWIEKEAKGRIKQLYLSTGITIGELEFKKFDLAFLNDTLVAISFYPNDKIEADVINHYKDKYGNGRGHYKYYNSIETVGNDIKATKKTDEKHSWANEEVALDYVKNEYFHMEPGKSSTGFFEKSLLIYSKNRYPVFENLIKTLSNQYDELKQDDKKKAINVL